MTREEAIEQIRKDICCEKPIQHHCKDGCMNGKEHCAYSLAIADMEKQIPKKGIPYNSAKNHKFIECPVCRGELDLYYKYCTECGQALSWSEERG